MVLAGPTGGAAGCGAPALGSALMRSRRAGAGVLARAGGLRVGGERGSQSLELAMCLPAVVLVVALVVHAGLLGVDLVTTHGLAREAARAAAVDADPHDLVGRSRPSASVEVRAVGPDHVEAVVTVPTRAFRALGVDHEVHAAATMRRER